MKTLVTRRELKECVTNAIKKIVEEEYEKKMNKMEDFDDTRKDFNKKKNTKHGSMKPVKKEKYKNWMYTDDEDEDEFDHNY